MGNGKRAKLGILLTACLALGLLGPALAEEASKTAQAEKASTGKARPPLKSPGDALRLEVELVLVPVTITDPFNRLVTGLEKEHFKLYEDKVEQQVTHFSNEDVPISLGVVFDVSGSMTNKIDRSRMAALQFFKTANPSDEFFLVEFSSEARAVNGFTSSVEEIQNKLMYTHAGGRTALLDAIYLALSMMKQATYNKKAILIISDGGDNHSRYNMNDIKGFVREADVQIYAIGIFDPGAVRSGTPEIAAGPGLLSEICEMTGGREFPVEIQNLSELPDIAAKISMELRNQYVLGYRPLNTVHDGRWRKIKVKLFPPKGLPPLNVYAKTGYYAPSH